MLVFDLPVMLFPHAWPMVWDWSNLCIPRRVKISHEQRDCVVSKEQHGVASLSVPTRIFFPHKVVYATLVSKSREFSPWTALQSLLLLHEMISLDLAGFSVHGFSLLSDCFLSEQERELTFHHGIWDPFRGRLAAFTYCRRPDSYKG